MESPLGDQEIHRRIHYYQRASQSKKIPYWMWYMIAKSLGIKLHENDKPIVATILYVLTISSASCKYIDLLNFIGIKATFF